MSEKREKPLLARFKGYLLKGTGNSDVHIVAAKAYVPFGTIYRLYCGREVGVPSMQVVKAEAPTCKRCIQVLAQLASERAKERP